MAERLGFKLVTVSPSWATSSVTLEFTVRAIYDAPRDNETCCSISIPAPEHIAGARFGGLVRHPAENAAACPGLQTVDAMFRNSHNRPGPTLSAPSS